MPITLLQDAFTRPASTFEMLRLSLVTTLAGRWEDLNLAARAVQRRGGLTPAQNAQFESSLEDYAQAHGAGAADPTLDIDRDLADIDADVQAILDATEPPRGEPEQEEPLDVIGAALSLLCDILADHVFGFTILRAEEAERIRVLIDEASADLDDDEGDDDAAGKETAEN